MWKGLIEREKEKAQEDPIFWDEGSIIQFYI
jgi:hypothetical protein